MDKVLLGQLGSNGDCLYATTIARQIKADHPDCHLTWAIGDLCSNVIANNPDVDDVWELPVGDWARLDDTWRMFEREAWREQARGVYDHVYLTQICPSNFANYDGTIRPSLFRNYPREITVPVETVISLSDQEQEKVDQFARDNKLDSYDHVVIFECSSKSGQSFVTPEIAVEIAEKALQKTPNTAFVLSTHLPIDSASNAIINGGPLSMRETAALTHHADLFVGCGSGLTVVATSAAAKPNLPNIQILRRHTSVYASFKHDWAYFGRPTDHFLETTSENIDRLAVIVALALEEGIETVDMEYGEDIPVNLKWYFELIDQMLVRKREFVDAAQSLCITMERYGVRKDLKRFAKIMVTPFFALDPKSAFPHGQAVIERLRGLIGRF